MDKSFLIQLTTNVYRLTLLFPKKEPLRYKIRELADDILAGLISLSGVRPLQNLQRSDPWEFDRGQTSGILEKLEILDSFFELSKVQNWVNSEEILKIQKDYSKIKEELSPSLKVPEVRSLQIFEKPARCPSVEIRLQQIQQARSISERQEKILAILREKEKAQVWEVKKIFPEVSKRTLRRDFENLLKQGFIERIGERNETYYQLNKAVSNL